MSGGILSELLVCNGISSSDSEPSLGDIGWLGGGRGTGRAVRKLVSVKSSSGCLVRLTFTRRKGERTLRRNRRGSPSALARWKRDRTI